MWEWLAAQAREAPCAAAFMLGTPVLLFVAFAIQRVWSKIENARLEREQWQRASEKAERENREKAGRLYHSEHAQLLFDLKGVGLSIVGAGLSCVSLALPRVLP